MGLDNDCTAATAGSIWGAVHGKAAIPKHWHKNFNNKVHTFLIGQSTFALDDMIDRFIAQAELILASCLTTTLNDESPVPHRQRGNFTGRAPREGRVIEIRSMRGGR